MSTDTNKRAPRPIDPPSLPPWLSRSDLVVDDADADAALEAADPTADAKPPEAGLSAASAPAAPAQEEPVTEKIQPQEDPRALAERLAREAKARLAEQKVAEAKARAEALRREQESARDDSAAAQKQRPAALKRSAPPPKPAAPAPKAAAPEPEPEPADAKVSLAARASKAKRPMSAQEALAAALASEPKPTRAKKPKQRTAAATPPAEQPRAPTPASVANPAARSADPAAAAAPATNAADLGRAAALVATLLPGAQLKGAPVAVANAEVFRALWKAHRARALHEGDFAVVATASVLLDAVDRVPAGRLFGVRVSAGEAERAVWIDIDRKALLGIATPADVYLTGL